MQEILLFGFVAMTALALSSISYGFYLVRKMESASFRREVFEEVARENHEKHVMLKRSLTNDC